jgi:branched-chain amino acid transport system permease protein
MGLPLPIALLLAIVIPAIVGIIMEKVAIEPVKGADTVSLIIITIGASLVIRGLIQVWLGKGTFSMPAFSGDEPIHFGCNTFASESVGFGGHCSTGGFVVVLLQPNTDRQGHAGHFIQ